MIALAVPEKVRTQLDGISQTVLQMPLKVRTPHLTLIPPFTTAEPTQKIVDIVQGNGLNLSKTELSLSRLQFFHQHRRHVLVSSVEPTALVTDLHTLILEKVQSFIQIDLSPYSDGILPPFDPHITLNYNARLIDEKVLRETQPLLQNIKFHLPHPVVFFEKEKGVWVTMGSNH